MISRIAVLKSVQIKYEAKIHHREREKLYIMVNETIEQENIAIINRYK